MSSKSILFSPLTIRGVTFKNRICVSPMCQYSAEDGFANDWHLVNCGSFATGGAALVILESTAVEARGRITPGDLGLWKDEQIEPLKRIAKFLKSQGTVPGIQLLHAGRKASIVPPWAGRNSIAIEDGGWSTISASPIAFGDLITVVPKEATLEDMQQIKNCWVSAAKRAVLAGFQVIELSFCHGYFVNSFLCPCTNTRTDKYGGSLENRMRYALEVADEIRKNLPQNIVIGVRISVTDYVDNGWDVNQSIEFSKQLKKIGIDFIDSISGGVVSNIDYNALNANEVQLKAAAIIQKEVGIPTTAVGKIVDPHFAEKILQENGASLVLIGRAFLNNPHWPYMAADALADEKSFKYPNQYDWCIGWKGLAKWRKDIYKEQNNNS